MTSNTEPQTETHPWEPWIPDGAKVLLMGTFPPGQHRRAMEFYYPNRTNDFWKVMGMLFEESAEAFYDRVTRSYRLGAIKEMLTKRGIALSDTGLRIKRLKGNASDKYLEIVEPVDLLNLLQRMPECIAIAATGEKAAGVVAQLTSTTVPAVADSVRWTSPDGRKMSLWRLPSTSRAYPLAPEKKAEAYRKFFEAAGIL